tara:strand:+ start:616 stop:1182 length:567 start_codon:yes stop_codon:yes gene_type:complete
MERTPTNTINEMIRSIIPVRRPDSFEDKAALTIMRLEGLKFSKEFPDMVEAYREPDGTITSGYGDNSPIYKEGDLSTVKESERRLREINIPRELNKARMLFPNFDSFPMDDRVNIFAEVFRGSFKSDHDTVKFINSGNYIKAAAEFLNNDEYRRAKKEGLGTAERMEAASKAIRNLGGSIKPKAREYK